MAGMDMTVAQMETPAPGATPIIALVAPPSDAPVKAFTLTAETATVDLGNGQKVNAYSYNGTLPGPELRVQQGDMVQVTLINHLPESTTIHWHGMSVPNAEDGVAGLTQDAVKPGEAYTYRFIATDVGTYWYHSHQNTSKQLPDGLYGAIIVEPKDPPIHYDHDYTVVLHEWLTGGACQQTCPELLMVNNRIDQASFAAKPDETVRLRIIEGGDDFHSPVLVGAPFKVIALDGHDLNGPTPLSNVVLPVATAQRYDLNFTMPDRGPVVLIDGDPRAVPAHQHPMVVIGDGQPNVTYPENLPTFDFTSYGTPAADTITLNSHFSAQYTMDLGNQIGFFNGGLTLTFPINGQTYPNIPSIKVNLGDIVEIHFANSGGMFPIPHVMHLHGHYFTVLAHNGKPLTGSPVHVDSLEVNAGESYDVAFVANNPGLWMLHCHILAHDAQGMDMMIEYPNIYTPFNVASSPNAGNYPF